VGQRQSGYRAALKALFRHESDTARVALRRIQPSYRLFTLEHHHVESGTRIFAGQGSQQFLLAIA
jgi:hypothetical protein